jgi:hypothetical protein
VDRLGLAGVPRHGRAASKGVAVTYARRYALFTLVGIAGNAPDLNCRVTEVAAGGALESEACAA